MRAIARLLSCYTVWLCRAFRVTPEFIVRDRRGNMPPPSGGIGAT
jgi:hypothetical protein